MSKEARLPPKPSIPFVLHLLAAGIAMARLCIWLDTSWQGLAAALAAGALGLAAGVGVLYRRKNTGSARFIALLYLCCALTAASTTLALEKLYTTARALSAGSISTWTFTVESAPSEGRYGYSAKARATNGHVSGMVWLGSSERLQRGECVRCVGRFTAAAADDHASRMQGVCGRVRIVKLLERSPSAGANTLFSAINAGVIDSFKPAASAERALLSACICANRDALESFGLDGLFSRTGMSHLVAVSGTHLSLVGSIAGFALSKTRMGPKARGAALVALTSAFVLFCGEPHSAVRAQLMQVAAFGSLLAGRRGDGLSACCAACLCMLLLDPYCAASLGYVLSAAAVVGLCLFGPYARYALELVVGSLLPLRRLLSRMGLKGSAVVMQTQNLIAASIVCQLVTAPFTLPIFHKLSLVAPVASLATAPLFGAFLAFGLLAALTSWIAPVQALVLFLCDALAAAILTALRFCAQAPFASVPIDVAAPVAAGLVIIAAILLLRFWPKLDQRRARTAAAASALACALALAISLFAARPSLRVIDVGQGDAILLRDGASAVLVDTGPDASVVAGLGRAGVVRLDAVLITHLHDDHYGGLKDVLSAVDVDRILVGEGAKEGLEQLLARSWRVPEIVEIGYRDALGAGLFTATVVWPHESCDGSQNAHSVELLVTRAGVEGGFSALLTGDGEQDELAGIIAAGDVGRVDMLKVGHHGSAISLTAEQARMLAPALAVASAGAGNEFGHPRSDCVAALQEAGATFLCTIDCGDICVYPEAQGMKLATQKGQRGAGVALAKIIERTRPGRFVAK